MLGLLVLPGPLVLQPLSFWGRLLSISFILSHIGLAANSLDTVCLLLFLLPCSSLCYEYCELLASWGWAAPTPSGQPGGFPYPLRDQLSDLQCNGGVIPTLQGIAGGPVGLADGPVLVASHAALAGGMAPSVTTSSSSASGVLPLLPGASSLASSTVLAPLAGQSTLDVSSVQGVGGSVLLYNATNACFAYGPISAASSTQPCGQNRCQCCHRVIPTATVQSWATNKVFFSF